MKKTKSILKFYLSVLLCAFELSLHAQNPFIQNKGQLPGQVQAKVNLPSGALFIEEGKLTYAFYSGEQLAQIHDLEKVDRLVDAHSYTVDFLNSNNTIISELYDESKYYENYYTGEKEAWATNVKSYKSLVQKNIYEDIDIKYYVAKDKLKYDIFIGPYSDPNKLKIKYNSLDNIRLSGGNLYISTSINTVTEYHPYAYQIINGNEVEVACNYKLEKDILSFTFPNGYNKNYELVIDPILEFSTYSGSTTDNFGYTATYDDFGFLYAGSTSFGIGYPTTIGAYQINYANSSGGTDVAITKYDTTGTQRIYSTYLGGSKDELPHSMIVNSANELFIYGTTGSSDFPTTSSSFQPDFNGGTTFAPSGIGVSFPNGSDIFVSRLSANGGSLLASTFIGGTGNDGLNTASKLKYNYADEVRGEIDIDKNNNIYIATCTQSTDFPTKNGFQQTSSGAQEGCVVKMDNQLTSIIWCSYLGGSEDDAIYSLAIDDNDDIYVTGGTNSSDFPTTSNAHQTNYQDSINADAFIAKVSSNGNQILSSSYFGTEKYDQSYFVEIGNTNLVYLFGQTRITGTQMINNATYSVVDGGQFVAVFNKDLSALIRSTVVGTGKGTPDISPTAFLVDVCDKIYLSGWGSNLGGPLSTLNLPISTNAYQQTTDGNDFYLMVLDEDLSSMIYATYFGGSQSNEHVDGGTSRFDKKGIIYQSACAGCGGNSDFPIEPNPGAVSTTNNSINCNNGVFKFNFDFPMVVADFNAPWVGCDTSLSFQNLSISSSNVNYLWDFGDGTTSTNSNPNHNYSQNGLYNVTLITSDVGACNIVDTITKQIYILSNSSDTIQSLSKCSGDQIQIGMLPVNDPSINYFWFPSISLSSANVSNPFTNISTSQQFQLLISNGSCTDTLYQNIEVTNLQLDAGSDTSYCKDPVDLVATFSPDVTSVVWSSNNNFTDTLSISNTLNIATVAMFYIKVSDGFCEQVDSVEVKMESINIDVFANDICLGDSALIGVTNLNPIVPIISYNWSTNNLNTSAFIAHPDTSKWYSVEVINVDGCIIKDSVFVNVNPYPTIDSVLISDTILFKGENVEIQVFSADGIFWEDFDNNSLQGFVAQTTKCYIFEIRNEYKCIVKDSICIEVKDVFCDDSNIIIPTAFSPNNDAQKLNETYSINDKDGIITKFRIEIFNRLGQKVFESTDKVFEWDGTFKGNKLLPQVFDFYIELECIGRKTLFRKGNITLIR